MFVFYDDYCHNDYYLFFGGKKFSLTITMITFTIGKKKRGPSNIIKNHQDDDDSMEIRYIDRYFKGRDLFLLLSPFYYHRYCYYYY